MTFIVATNVIASRPPERRPTGTPHARAKRFEADFCKNADFVKSLNHSFWFYIKKCNLVLIKTRGGCVLNKTQGGSSLK